MIYINTCGIDSLLNKWNFEKENVEKNGEYVTHKKESERYGQKNDSWNFIYIASVVISFSCLFLLLLFIGCFSLKSFPLGYMEGGLAIVISCGVIAIVSKIMENRYYRLYQLENNSCKEIEGRIKSNIENNIENAVLSNKMTRLFVKKYEYDKNNKLYSIYLQDNLNDQNVVLEIYESSLKIEYNEDKNDLNYYFKCFELETEYENKTYGYKLSTGIVVTNKIESIKPILICPYRDKISKMESI